jgi:hypothetical protein
MFELIALATVGLVIFLFSLALASGPPPSAEPGVAKSMNLRREIEDLRERVTRLEAKVAHGDAGPGHAV